MQFEAGAEIVYVFDTNSSQLDNNYFSKIYTEKLQQELFSPFKNKIAYYSKNLYTFEPGKTKLKLSDLAGLVYPTSSGFVPAVKSHKNGFIQGNFSPKSLLKPHDIFVKDFEIFIDKMSSLKQDDRNGWICSLNHGVLPKTPEINVKYFINKIRSTFSKK
jgi:uroporphyrinogen decarboxylase